MTIRTSAMRPRYVRALLLVLVLGLLTPRRGLAQQYGEEPKPRAVSESHAVADFGARFVGIDDVDSQSFAGGVTWYAPVGDRLGFALGGDLGFGAVEGDFGEVIGLHTAGFWRNPESGYLGAAVVFDHVSDFQRVNASAIGGIYVNELDLMTAAGYDGGDGPGVGLFAFELGYYVSHHFRLGGGFEFGTDETIAGGAMLHWQPAPDSPVTLRLNAGGGELDDEGFYSVGIGLTLSFADRKSLRDQLRGDRLLFFE